MKQQPNDRCQFFPLQLLTKRSTMPSHAKNINAYPETIGGASKEKGQHRPSQASICTTNQGLTCTPWESWRPGQCTCQGSLRSLPPPAAPAWHHPLPAITYRSQCYSSCVAADRLSYSTKTTHNACTQTTQDACDGIFIEEQGLSEESRTSHCGMAQMSVCRMCCASAALTATSSKVMPVSGTSWNLDLLRPKSMGPPMGPMGLPPWPPPARLRQHPASISICTPTASALHSFSSWSGTLLEMATACCNSIGL